jgi:Alpha-1,3-glucanase catalytic domain D1
MPLLDRGATPAYWEYQAEDADTNGTHIGPSRQLGDMASEASQRKAVKLDLPVNTFASPPKGADE